MESAALWNKLFNFPVIRHMQKFFHKHFRYFLIFKPNGDSTHTSEGENEP